MTLKAYNSEKFDRTKWRYIIFVALFVITIAVSFFAKNIWWWILMFFLLWAYIYYWLIDTREITIQISESWIITQHLIPRAQLSWFCLELELDKEKNAKRVKNIVFVTTKSHYIHTIIDTQEQLSLFVKELSQYTVMLEDYPLTSREKFMRKIKL